MRRYLFLFAIAGLFSACSSPTVANECTEQTPEYCETGWPTSGN